MRRTIDTIFATAARDASARTHLKLPDGASQSYSETFERASRLAGALVRRGIEKGDRLVIVMANGRALYECYIASSMVGAITVPVNTQCTEYELERLIVDCAPTGCVVDAHGIGKIAPHRMPGLKAHITTASPSGDWEDLESVLEEGPPLDAPRSDEDDACLIIYSSGTTGDPKGIVLRQRSLMENARRVMGRLRISEQDVLIALLPSFHLFGYSYDFMYSGIARAPLAVMSGFTVEGAMAAIRTHRVTLLSGVPTMFARLLDAERLASSDVDSVRLLVVGGGPVSPELLKRLRARGIDAVESYGQTEISTTSTIEIPGAPSPEGSCGPALPGFEVRVVDTDGNDVPAGEPGELLFRSPTFMQGYWNQPELTEATLSGGWLHTGDVGRMDADGNLYILDRVKDMIVANGFNIFPKEVENAIVLHPSVMTVAVVGVPDEIRGEDVHAFIVPSSGKTVDLDELVDHCTRHLARYKLPRHISIVEDLPMTANGKIRRFKLREMAQNEIIEERAFRVDRSGKSSSDASGAHSS